MFMGKKGLSQDTNTTFRDVFGAGSLKLGEN